MRTPAQPRDACPYPRPFPDSFDACPAYHARPFIALDVNYRPLPPVWTCRHLDTRRSGQPPHGFYAHCALGDVVARVRWVEKAGQERFDRMRRLERETIEFELPYLVKLEALKGRELMPAYVSGKPGVEQIRGEMLQLKAQMLRDLRSVLERQAPELAELGVTVEDALQLTEGWLDYLIARPSTVIESWDLPPNQLDRVPDELRALMSPSQPQSRLED